MRLADTLSLSTRMFKTRPMRTFLTVLGVGVGIGTVLFLVSLGYGMQHLILGRIATAETLLTLDVTSGPTTTLELTQSNIDRMRTIPSIVDISRLKTYAAQLTMGELTGNGRVVAVDYAFLRGRSVRMMAGTMEDPEGQRIAYLSSAGVKLFNKSPEEILGERVKLSLLVPKDDGLVEAVNLSGSYVIGGVFEDENVSYVYITLDMLSGISVEPFDAAKVKVSDSGQLETARQALIEQGFVVSAVSDIVEQATKIFHIMQIVLALFGLVALVVSAIGMFNTMTITLLERTNEIGIMRSIGITQKDVRSLFLVEAMLMGFLGGIGGIIIGVIAGFIANIGVNMLAVRFGGSAVQLFYVPAWFVIVIIIFSTCIGFITGVFPSRRAAKLNPLDALRYK